MQALPVRLLCLLALVGCRASAPEGVTAVVMPDNDPGIGFDDMHFSAVHGAFLVPGGRSGTLNLVDPVSHHVDSIDGFSREIFYFGGSYQGATSADDGPDGLIYVTDRTPKKLYVVDPAQHALLVMRQLGSGFDYVRYVDSNREIWITEPDSERIEILSVGTDTRSAPAHVAYLSTPGGPESIVVDHKRGRVYTHVWAGKTYAIDVTGRSIAATWANGCQGSRGIALDEARGFLFVGCAEGLAVVLDVATGAQLASAKTGTGVDIIAYDDTRQRLYFPAAASANLTILQVGPNGALSVLGTLPSVEHGHCGAVAPGGIVAICDPDNGQVLLEKDPYP